MSLHSPILLVDDEAERRNSVVSLLEAQGHKAFRTADRLPPAQGSNGEPPLLLIVAESHSRNRGDNLLQFEAALSRGVSVIAILDDATDPASLGRILGRFDDWVASGSLGRELLPRINKVLSKSGAVNDSGSHKLSVDTSFLALLVHDIRNPLNVLKLSFRLLSQAMPRADADFAEDLRFAEENVIHIERMLKQISDYMRMYDGEFPPPPVEFSPFRLVDELVQERTLTLGPKAGRILIEPDATCPAAVSLDPRMARTALHYVLENARSAHADQTIRVRLEGGPERWVTRVTVEKPPPSSVTSVALGSRTIERLCGSEKERRGLDLAIAARVSEVFGGTARLEAVPGERTIVELDWPARLDAAN